MSTLSASAVIVIVVVVSALLVTILWVFSGYYGQVLSGRSRAPITQEQDAYMRQVRQRSHQFAYVESVITGSRGGSGSGGAAPTTPGASQEWSSNHIGTSPNSPEASGPGPGAGGWVHSGSSRTDGYGQNVGQNSHQDGYYMNMNPQEKNQSYVNYSTYEEAEQAEQHYEQSPYESHDYYYPPSEQPVQMMQQLPEEKSPPIPPHQQV